MDLRQIMCAFAVMAGGGFAILGLWLITTGEHNARPLAAHHRAGAITSDVVSGLVLLAVGAGMVGISLMSAVGPWRPHDEPVFPMRVLDLNTPPSPLDRTHPPSP